MKDRVYLILSGIIVSIVLFVGVGAILYNELLSEEWFMFAAGAILYLGVTLYLLVTEKIVKLKLLKLHEYLVVFPTLTSPVIILFFLFYFRLIPMPDYLLPYTLFSIIFGPMFLMVTEFLLKSKDKN
jgi:hypothetical protein